MVENGIRKSGFEEVGLLSLSSADHTEIGEVAKGLADRYEGSKRPSGCPSSRVDAFNITLANEFSRNGRRSGLTFAPEGGSERMRRVINKMVTEEDLIRTVAAAYSHGWRQEGKLYFMCGLPTETDDDVLAIADLAKKVIAKGREVSGRNDIRCTVSIGGFVPKPHTPFQWARAARPRDHRRPAAEATRHRAGRQEVRPRDRLPLPRRQAGHYRRTAVPWRPPGRCGHRAGVARRRPVRRLERALPYDRWVACAEKGSRAPTSTSTGTPPASASTTRFSPGTTSTPGSHKDWLWADWEDSLAVADGADIEVEDCRWTPCYDCGVCPELNTEIQIGPTGRQLLPLSVV